MHPIRACLPQKRGDWGLGWVACLLGLGFRVQGLEFLGLGFRAQGLEFLGLGFRSWCLC